MNRPGGNRVLFVLILAFGLSGGFVAGWKSSRGLKVAAHAETQRLHLQAKGDAPPVIRAEVLNALRELQEGYVRRDPRQLDVFMERLFSRDQDARVLGTGADEWETGYDAIARFVRDDWLNWGDVSLTVEQATVSSAGGVAWLATTGMVTSGSSARPIRLTAVLTRRDARWVFRQIHFQWDERLLGLRDLLRLVGRS